MESHQQKYEYCGRKYVRKVSNNIIVGKKGILLTEFKTYHSGILTN